MDIFDCIVFPDKHEREIISKKFFKFSDLKNNFKVFESGSLLTQDAYKIKNWNDEINAYTLDLEIPFFFFIKTYNSDVVSLAGKSISEEILLKIRICLHFIEEFLERLYAYINKIKKSIVEIFEVQDSKSLSKIKKTDSTRFLINQFKVKAEFNLLESAFNKFLIKYRPLQDMRKVFVHYQSDFVVKHSVFEKNDASKFLNINGILEAGRGILNILNVLKDMKGDYNMLINTYTKRVNL